ncbi:metal-dependent hydrolase [Haladaptatus sp. GCM10025707]|uniref:metal-dependent hydrolase n=1 Tax=unclassified Haladaptatus TaxID=2622732 RepID=UPI0023E8BDE0|nr:MULTISPECIES: metal-dependent hydrolase [unclassified Haladaptatus]
MWPWEHLAFAYLLYSLFAHTVYRRSPDGAAAFLVVLGSQAPDLVDKPLSWTFGLTPTGHGFMHSILIMGPLLAGALVLTSGRTRRLVAAYTIAHFSHLVGDLIYEPLLLNEPLILGRVLWPVVSLPAYGTDQGGLVGRAAVYFVRWIGHIASQGLTPLVIFEFALVFGVIALWLYDGAPVLSDLIRYARAE